MRTLLTAPSLQSGRQRRTSRKCLHTNHGHGFRALGDMGNCSISGDPGDNCTRHNSINFIACHYSSCFQDRSSRRNGSATYVYLRDDAVLAQGHTSVSRTSNENCLISTVLPGELEGCQSHQNLERCETLRSWEDRSCNFLEKIRCPSPPQPGTLHRIR